MSAAINDGFNHSYQWFVVGQRVRVPYYLTGPVENCTINKVAASVGGWFYEVAAENGDTRVFQADQLEAL